MFRTRLQELCHQRRWAPPVYEHTREGPDHAPLFRATVLVHDEKFSSPDEGARSTKEAYHLAAMAAFEHLAAFPAAIAPPVPDSRTRFRPLQRFGSLKRRKTLPSNRCIYGGSHHAPLFKSEVSIDGHTFESPEYYRTKKEAEIAAAKVALMELSKNKVALMSLPQEASPPQQYLVLSVSYKNLLQELAQKEGFPLPVYTTTSYVSNHSAAFISTVKIQELSTEVEVMNSSLQVAEPSIAEPSTEGEVVDMKGSRTAT